MLDKERRGDVTCKVGGREMGGKRTWRGRRKSGARTEHRDARWKLVTSLIDLLL